ncbi:MAG: chitobiase/beta-hexosaminidase C-terminal domain-containing protein [Janthinobacterium lividum]
MRSTLWTLRTRLLTNACFLLFALVLVIQSSAQGSCPGGTGTCSDRFTGPAATTLSSYNSAWVKIKGSSDAYTTGVGTVAIPGSTFAYYGYATSSSDASQITVQPSNTTNSYAREACVRLTAGLGGYCVGFGGVSGGTYSNCYIEKTGQYLGSGNCGTISATVSHTLALVVSNKSPLTLDVYLDGVRTASVSDGGQALTAQKSGFGLTGDGVAANSQATAWQDFQGLSLSTFFSPAVPAATPYACSTGSGSCYDTFAGTNGTSLPKYNAMWVKAKGTSDAYVTGSNTVQMPGTSYAYYYYNASSSDTSQILVPPSTGNQAYAREACVRVTPNVGGYCLAFGGVSNGTYNNCYVEKGGQYLGAGSCGTPSATVSHTLAVVAVGTAPVTLQIYLDGVAMHSVVDTIGTYRVARSGFAVTGSGNPADSTTGTWRDYREVTTADAPTFLPAAGSFSSAQTVALLSTSPAAVLHYTLDGSTPTAISPVYSNLISVSTSKTLKAIAMVNGQTTSAVSTATYLINPPPAAAPVFTVPSPYTGYSTLVGITSNMAGARIVYCLDVSNTCVPSVPYTGLISFATTGYIRAQTLLAGYSPSAITSWQGTWSTVQITASACPEGTQYTTYPGCTITVAGGLPPYIFSWSKTNGDGMVEGLTLNPLTGKITGTVYGQGAYSVAITVTDGTQSTVTKTVRMPMRGDNTLAGCSLFPADSVWHMNVANLPVDTSAAAAMYPGYAAQALHLVFGSEISDGGIPFLRVPYNQQNVPVTTTQYQSYFTSAPIPSYAPIEGTINGGADGHVSVVQTGGAGNHCKLWEMYQGAPTSNGWTDSSNAYWDLESYDMLPQDNGSTDAAGLPIAPLLWNYDEVAGGCAKGAECGVVKHPARLTLNHTLNYHVWPATAQSGNGYCIGGYQDSNRLLSQTQPPIYCSGGSPMGEIYRLKSSATSPAACVGHPQAQVLITAMKNYGLMITDNGTTGGVVATADSRWDDTDLSCLTNIKLTDFEPVNVSSKMIDLNSSRVRP